MKLTAQEMDTLYQAVVERRHLLDQLRNRYRNNENFLKEIKEDRTILDEAWDKIHKIV